MNLPAWFTIRVYGLYVEHEKVLVSDEIIKGRQITKFPGGGLQYGEGLKECLVREIMEEMGAQAIELEHFYTTDHFQQSAFHTEPMQVISAYYSFKLKDPEKLQ
ncbi:MAG: NUDIX domain-containing protein, partial [Bacteroidota bacterium]|nr:NUDIX domain-containing protein [Bacteroidota bacterium]